MRPRASRSRSLRGQRRRRRRLGPAARRARLSSRLAVPACRPRAPFQPRDGGERRVACDQGRSRHARLRGQRRRRCGCGGVRPRRRLPHGRQRRRRRLPGRPRGGQVVRARLPRDGPRRRRARHVPRPRRQADGGLARRLAVGGRPRDGRGALGGCGSSSARSRSPGPSLLAPAIDLADRGFVVDAGFEKPIAIVQTKLARYPSSAALFLPGGAPPAVGTTWRNADLAAVLRRVASDGPAGFYDGPVAEAIARAMKEGEGPHHPGRSQGVPCEVARPLRVPVPRADDRRNASAFVGRGHAWR